GAWTTCSWSGCGGVSSTRTSTCGGTRRCPSYSRGWGATYFITTRRVCTRPWSTGPRRRSIGGGEPAAGRRGEREAFFFAPPSLSPQGREGGAKKNALGQGRASAMWESGVLQDGS